MKPVSAHSTVSLWAFALIGGIGDGTACFWVDEVLRPSPLWFELSRLGPGLMLALITVVYLGNASGQRIDSWKPHLRIALVCFLSWVMAYGVGRILLSWADVYYQLTMLLQVVITLLVVMLAVVVLYTSLPREPGPVPGFAPRLNLFLVGGLSASLFQFAAALDAWPDTLLGHLSRAVLLNVLLFSPWLYCWLRMLRQSLQGPVAVAGANSCSSRVGSSSCRRPANAVT